MYVSAEVVRGLLAAGLEPLSLDEPLDAQRGGCLAEVVADEAAPGPASLFFARELALRTQDRSAAARARIWNRRANPGDVGRTAPAPMSRRTSWTPRHRADITRG
jgi:hypothetical protein